MLAENIKTLLLGGTKYYPVSDTDTTLSTQGKTWSAVPEKFTIKSGTTLINPYMLRGVSGGFVPDFTVGKDSEVTCVGAGRDFYYFTGFVNADSSGDYMVGYYTTGQAYANSTPGYVKKTDVKNIIWGGNVLAIYLKQLLALLYRKVALVC